MGSSITHLCTLCQEDTVSSQAISWCLECEDWLCINCERHHGRSKTSKEHKIITVAAYETLPPSVLKISKRCSEHHFIFDRFCSFHGAPCCIQCIRETHKECELSPLANVLQNVKESVAVFHLERDLNEIQKNLEVIKKYFLERLSKVHEKKKHCLKEIKRFRTSVNEHMDTIERNILDALSQKENDIKKTAESMASQIESKKRRVVNLQESFLKTKQYGTDLQLFMSIKETEKQTCEDAKYLDDLETGDIMADKSLEFDVSPALKSLQRDIDAFGKISVNSVTSKLKLSRTSQGQAHLFVPVVPTLENVNLVKTLTINFTGRWSQIITAGAILPTGECVFTDHGNGRLVLYNTNGTYVRDVVKTDDYPYDMCYIKDNVVGISFPYKHKVHVIDVSKNKVTKTLQMEGRCDGIDCNDGKILVRLWDKNTVVIKDLDGKIHQRVNIPGKDVAGIAFYKNKIYCTNWKTSEVLCYDMQGKLVWKQNYEALTTPQSISIDKRSDIIYVAGLNSNSLLAISLDGGQSKVILSKEDGLNKPHSVHVSTDNKLLVCNSENGLAFVYQL